MGEIRHNDWIAELARVARTAGADGLTTSEIAEQTGKSQLLAREMLKRAIQAGLWTCAGRKMVPAIDGTERPVQCYRPIKRKKP